MNIAVLMGSPRKKDSYRICQIIEKSFSRESEVKFEYLYLKDFYIEECWGCDQCFQKGEDRCPCKDDLKNLKERLLLADGIIFASPVYACQITGTLKRVFDRMSYLFHRQEFVGKPALTVVTTGGGGLKATGSYLKMTACGWGCHLVGEITIISPQFFKTVKDQSSPFGYNRKYHDKKLQRIQNISKSFEQALLTKELPVPSFYDIFLFQCLRSKTFVSEVDYEFWKKKGWLDSLYFYESQISPVKIIFARIMKAYINRAARQILRTKKS